MDIDIKNNESSLKLHELYVSEIKFSTNKDESKVSPDIKRSYADNKYSLKYKAFSKNQFFKVILNAIIMSYDNLSALDIELTALFTIENGELSNEIISMLLKQNAVAIMFPFLRTYVASISHMTNLREMTLPIFNVAAALSKSQKDISHSKEHEID